VETINSKENIKKFFIGFVFFFATLHLLGNSLPHEPQPSLKPFYLGEALLSTIIQLLQTSGAELITLPYAMSQRATTTPQDVYYVCTHMA
jgi:hypothetical protein